MPPFLPDDIIYLICEELYLLQDVLHDSFSTLFNLATSSRSLAQWAIPPLYRMHSDNSQADEEAGGLNPIVQQELITQRWAITWRSIILSAMGKTLYPYCNYLRALDLRDLNELLEDPKFFGTDIDRVFFGGELSQFRFENKPQARITRFRKRLNVASIIISIGDVLAPQTHLVEDLQNPSFVSPDALMRWLPHLPRLQRLKFWDAQVLANAEVQNALYTNCPGLKILEIFMWIGNQVDQSFGTFLAGLRSNTLQELNTWRDCGVAIETCTALANHALSLTDLRLGFSVDTVHVLSNLAPCTSLVNLELELPYTVDLKATQNDVFNSMIHWLQSCHNLKTLKLSECSSSAAILEPVFMSDACNLRELSISAKHGFYVMKDNPKFHQALGRQTALQKLSLEGDGENMTSQDIDLFCDTLGQLRGLCELNLRGLPDDFDDQSVIRVLSALPELEILSICGYQPGSPISTDQVLEALASLPRLRNATFLTLSTFTFEGLLAFVEKLGPGNQNLELSVSSAHTSYRLSDEEQLVIQKALFEEVQGRFEYTLIRDPDVPEFEPDDSDD
ncbi:MAG: hypothetical protein M1831_004983 [Alyxoria varia]|nr:MAG: hypothetical protein M1831_004983 [Alyxoria varia]